MKVRVKTLELPGDPPVGPFKVEYPTIVADSEDTKEEVAAIEVVNTTQERMVGVVVGWLYALILATIQTRDSTALNSLVALVQLHGQANVTRVTAAMEQAQRELEEGQRENPDANV
jgi:hypothetical protein